MSSLSAVEDQLALPVLAPAALLGIARDLAREAEKWQALAQHRPDERWFLRVAAHEKFDTWLIGWDAHQGVDLHDHGGSAGALYVVEGELLETSGRRDGGAELATSASPPALRARWVPVTCTGSRIGRPRWRRVCTCTLRL
jgi:hypothetical protein